MDERSAPLHNQIRWLYPFCLLSGHRLAEAIRAANVIELEPGDRITLRGGHVTDFFYVLGGRVRWTTAQGEGGVATPETTAARAMKLPPAPHRLRLDAEEAAIVCRADGEVLEHLVTWETLASDMALGADDGYARTATVRQCLAFRRLPLECVEEAFRRMRRTRAAPGTDVVRQGDPGDAFYIIESGHFEVWQTGLYDDAPRKVAERGPGEAFGEEALVLQGRRNATVRATSEGTLLVLDRADFDELVSRPLVDQVESSVARALLESGCVALDVRYAEEFEEGHLPDALMLPLPELRERYEELDPHTRYLVYCKGGGRSRVGTLLLRQRNFDAVSLQGGIRDWPFELASEG